MQKSVGYVIWSQIFNKFHLFNFSEIFTILLRNINNSNSDRKVENIFLDKNSKKSLYYRKCMGQTTFWP